MYTLLNSSFKSVLGVAKAHEHMANMALPQKQANGWSGQNVGRCAEGPLASLWCQWTNPNLLYLSFFSTSTRVTIVLAAVNLTIPLPPQWPIKTRMVVG